MGIPQEIQAEEGPILLKQDLRSCPLTCICMWFFGHAVRLANRSVHVLLGQVEAYPSPADFTNISPGSLT